MTQFSRLLLAPAFAFAPGAAIAADYDYDPPIYIDEAPELVPVEIGSGWYIRGDIGYNLSVEPLGPAQYRLFDATGATYTPFTPFTTSAFDESFTYGVGFGYRFTDWLRSDITVDRFETDFSGTIPSGLPCLGGAAGTACRVDSAAEAAVTSAMANIYLDLGVIAGFSPYVGAGAGMAYVSWSDAANGHYCVDGATACTIGLQATTRHPGQSNWRFTYALMAGLAVDVTDNLKVDLGYRYRSLEGGDAAGWDAASATAGATGIQARDDGFDMHEVRVGLRYELW